MRERVSAGIHGVKSGKMETIEGERFEKVVIMQYGSGNLPGLLTY